MALSLNKPKLDNLAGDIWKSAERLRGKFKAYEYQNVILPIIVIRRLECVLIKWREDKRAEVLAKRPKLTEKELAKLVKELELNPEQAPFSNKTDWTLRKVYEEDHTLLEENFRAYINGFSKNVDDIIEHFNYRATIGQMVKNNRLAPILNQYKELELGPDKLSPLEMGYIYEELLRRFSEQSGEEAGEHFTPREVIRLMVELLEIPIPDRHISIYDPACGTGGMLSVAKEHLLDRAATPDRKGAASRNSSPSTARSFRRPTTPSAKPTCSSRTTSRPRSISATRSSRMTRTAKSRATSCPRRKFHFDFMLSNPPFGVTWGGKDGYETEARKLEKTRYQAGMPRVNDGALLFLQTMLAKMKPPEEGRQPHRHHLQRLAALQRRLRLGRKRNPPLDSGERLARRHRHAARPAFLQHRHLHLHLAAAKRKAASHRGRVMLIDARQQFEKEPKSFGNKRNRITDAHRALDRGALPRWLGKGYADEQVKIFRREDFAYHKVSVVFWQTDEHDQPAIITEPYEKAFTAANLKKEQEFYDSDLTFRVRVKADNEEKTVDIVAQARGQRRQEVQSA